MGFRTKGYENGRDRDMDPRNPRFEESDFKTLKERRKNRNLGFLKTLWNDMKWYIPFFLSRSRCSLVAEMWGKSKEVTKRFSEKKSASRFWLCYIYGCQTAIWRGRPSSLQSKGFSFCLKIHLSNVGFNFEKPWRTYFGFDLAGPREPGPAHCQFIYKINNI